MSKIIIGMTPDVAVAYDNMINAGIDGDLAFLQLARMVPGEILEIEDDQDEEPVEQVQDIGQELTPLDEETPVENIYTN
jgi:hypothetical protein